MAKKRSVKATSKPPAVPPASPVPTIDADQEWPVVKLTLQPNILEAIRGETGGAESDQHWIIRHLAEHFGIEPIIRQRGQRGKGKKAGAESIEGTE